VCNGEVASKFVSLKSVGLMKKLMSTFFGVVQIGAFLCLILSIATIFDSYHRLLELFSPFKVQFLVASFLCSMIFLAFKNFKSAIAMFFVVVLNSVFVLPWFFSEQNEVPENHLGSIKIMHSNVYSGNENYQEFIDFVLEEVPDVLVAQEVNDEWGIQLQGLKNVYPHSYLKPREDNFGIAIFSKYPYDDIEEYYWGLSYLPSLKAVITAFNKPVTIITTHPLPPINSDYYISRNAQIEKVANVSKHTETPLILIGDLNVTMWSSDYTPLELDAGLINTRKGFGVLPTWPTINPIIMIPIDHCLVSSHFVVRSTRVGRHIGSDHLPLIVELALKS
jgi:endonuclease/exonuclease/phosphatase (EEP) superfamily protein YafD